MPTVAFRLDLLHGRCVGVEIPETLSEGELATLPGAEQAFALGLAPARRPTWVAGRQALRAALGDLGLGGARPILATGRGAPLVPPGALGSISHKRKLAVALAAPGEAAPVGLGVDLELDAPLRVDISRRVLTSAELAAVDALAPDARRRALLLLLSAKEAIYKAVDPFVGRYVSFQEAEVTLADDGTARTTLRLAQDEGPFTAEVRWTTIAGHFLTTARIRPAPR